MKDRYFITFSRLDGIAQHVKVNSLKSVLELILAMQADEDYYRVKVIDNQNNKTIMDI